MKKKFLFRIAQIIIILIIIISLMKLLNYVLADDCDSYIRVALHEMYNQEENIDSLFLGSSHCEWGIDPAITDEIFQENTFNLGSAWQNLDRSYALLKEVGKTNNIENVYIDMYYEIRGSEDYALSTPSTSVFLISDYMKFSPNKCSLIINSCLKEEWVNGFFPARRNWEDIFDINTTRRIVTSKQDEKYKNFEYPSTESSKYTGKGHVAVPGTTELFIKNGHNQPISQNVLSDEDKKYLKKIIKYCDKKHINLVFFSTPMSDYTISDIRNYDDYVAQIKDFLGPIPYYDFNLMDYEKWKLEDSMFYDDHHLNAEGSRVFSNIFAEFFAGNISEEDLFLDKYVSKQDKLKNKFMGLVLESEKEEDSMNFEIVPVGDYPDQDFYFSISYLKNDDEREYSIQELQKNSSFQITEEDIDKIKIDIFEDCEGTLLITSFETEID